MLLDKEDFKSLERTYSSAIECGKEYHINKATKYKLRELIRVLGKSLLLTSNAQCNVKDCQDLVYDDSDKCLYHVHKQIEGN